MQEPTNPDGARKLVAPNIDSGKSVPVSCDASRWNLSDDNSVMDWMAELLHKDPSLHKRMSGAADARVSVGNNIAGNSFHNCTVTIKIVQPGDDDDKENHPATN